MDASGNLYIADQGTRIRRVNAASGVISTVAGNGVAGFSGDGGAATSASLAYPYGVALNASANLYIADYYNQRIRKIVFRPVEQNFNGDARSDLLYRNGGTGQIYRMFMDGLTIAGQGMAYTEPNTAWKVVDDADFNGDGVTDLLWRNDATGQVYVMLFNSSGMSA